jgi:predicted transcriptional regulator of viral defense system
VSRLAAEQHGVFTREQARACGLTEGQIRVRLDSGRWERLHPAVYRLAGARATPRQALVAACLRGGPGTTVSHRSAAALHGLPGGAAGVEITVPRRRVLRDPSILAHRTGPLPGVDVTAVDGVPVTTLARTLVDLAAVLRPEALEEALDSALSAGRVPRPRLAWRLGELAAKGRPGVEVLRSLLDARAPAAPVPASVLETRLGRVLAGPGLAGPGLAGPGLAAPVWGYEVRAGGRLAVLDCAYPQVRLAVEADGWQSHSGRARWEDDLARQNALVAAGWTVLRFPWSVIDQDPGQVRREVAETLARLRR